jgi:hypothetical protein
MKRIIPLFPLNIVVFPGELVNLHIFEPRYKQLIQDSREQGIRFGIPTYIKETIDYGTIVTLDKIHRVYDDERLDVSVRASDVFRVQDFQNPMKDKLYAGGAIAIQDNMDDADLLQKETLMDLLSELFDLFVMGDRFDLDQDFDTYTYAHKIGLTLEQEYELLTIRAESERMDYLIEYLQKSIPVIAQMEEAKEKIRANGHFKHLDPLKF